MIVLVNSNFLFHFRFSFIDHDAKNGMIEQKRNKQLLSTSTIYIIYKLFMSSNGDQSILI